MIRLTLFIQAVMAVAFSLNAQTIDTAAYMPLEKCLQMPGVKFTARCLGGHSGKCIEAVLRNNGSSPIQVRVEPGRRLVADSAKYQDIFVVKSNFITLQPGCEEKVELFGFCCESSDWGPGLDLKYSPGFMAPAAWVKLASFLDRNNFSTNAMQHAVWVLSNNHDIAGVDCGNREQTIALRQYLCDLTGKEMPWATIQYKQDSNVVFTGALTRIRGDIPYYVRSNSSVGVFVTDYTGRIVETLMTPSIHRSGQHNYSLDLDVSGYPKGDFEVRVYEDGTKLLERKRFSI